MFGCPLKRNSTHSRVSAELLHASILTQHDFETRGRVEFFERIIDVEQALLQLFLGVEASERDLALKDTLNPRLLAYKTSYLCMGIVLVCRASGYAWVS